MGNPSAPQLSMPLRRLNLATPPPGASSSTPQVATHAASSSPRSRRVELDVLRGFAILLVVLYHATIAMDSFLIERPAWLTAISEAATPFRMPVLMFLSGMLLPRSLSKPTGTYITGKLRGIAWPYVVWTTLIVCFYLWMDNYHDNLDPTWARVDEIVTSPATYTWYLAYLLAYYLIVLIIPARVRPWLIPVLLIMSGLSADERIIRFSFLFAMFLIGEWVAHHDKVWKLFAKPGVIALGALSTALFAAISVLGVPLRYTPISVIGVLGVVAFSIPVARRLHSTWIGTSLASIGRESLTFYVTHWLVIALTAQYLVKIEIVDPVLAVPIMIAVALVICVIAVILRKIVPGFSWLYVWPKSHSRSM